MRRSVFGAVLGIIVFPVLGEAQPGKEPARQLVKLQGDNLKVGEALSQLTKQTHVSVIDRRRTKESRTLKLHLNNLTFWQALDAIAKAADASVSLYERDGVIALVDGPHVDFPISYHGIFRIALKHLVARLDLETGSHRMIATLEIAWEPPYRPFLLETRPKKLVVRDDKNHDLTIKDEGGGQAPVDGKLATTVELDLPFVPRPAMRLGALQGELSLIGAPHMLTVAFDSLEDLERDPSKKSRTLEGVAVKVKKLQLNDDLWTVEMALEYPPAGPKFESFQSWLINNEIYLKRLNTDVKLPNNAGYSLESSSSNRAVVSYNFKDDKAKGIKRGKPADWQLIYVTPGVISEKVVPFSFTDVPLP